MGRRNFMRSENRLVVATTGSAFNYLMSNPDYFDFVIVDEVHEMSVDIDKTIAICRVFQAIHGFKLLLMSATIDVSSFLSSIPGSRHFALGVVARGEYKIYEQSVADCTIHGQKITAKVIQRDGKRGFIPFSNAPAFFSNYAAKSGILDNVALLIYQILEEECPYKFPGDILVFLPGLADFRELKNRLFALRKKVHGKHFKIEYMHSRFSQEYKSYVGEKAGHDKKQERPVEGREKTIIFTTNVCETSLTLPNISYVVDSCLSRKKLFVGGQFQLVTVPACYEAMMQRRGRLGRVSDGLYCVAIQDEIVSLLPRNYGTELMLESLDHFLLAYYSSEVAALASGLTPDKLLAGSMSKVGPQQIHFVENEMLNQGFLTRCADGSISISTLGFLPATLKVSLDMSRRISSSVFLGIPYVGLIFGALYSSTTSIFVHPIEVSQNQRAYRNSLDDERLVLLAASRFNPFFKCFSTNALLELGSLFTYRPDELDEPPEEWMNDMSAIIPQNARMPTTEGKIVDLLHRQGVTPFDCAYSELLSICHIVCMWRQTFPIPTKRPTKAETEWCNNRLLSPSGLREVELEAINIRMKLAGQGILTPPSQTEADLLHGIYPIDAPALDAKYRELDAFTPPKHSMFDENSGLINYVTMPRYVRATARVKEQLGLSYVPTLAGVYQEEKKYGVDTLTRLLGLSSLMAGYQGFLTANGSNDGPVHVLSDPSTASAFCTAQTNTKFATYLSSPKDLMPVVFEGTNRKPYPPDVIDYVTTYGSLSVASAEPATVNVGPSQKKALKLVLDGKEVAKVVGAKKPSNYDILRVYYENVITLAERIPYDSYAPGVSLNRDDLIHLGIANLLKAFKPSLMPCFSIYSFVLETNRLAKEYDSLLGDSAGGLNIGLENGTMKRLQAIREEEMDSPVPGIAMSPPSQSTDTIEQAPASEVAESSVRRSGRQLEDRSDSPANTPWDAQDMDIVESPERTDEIEDAKASDELATWTVKGAFKTPVLGKLPRYLLSGTAKPLMTALQACRSAVLEPRAAASAFIARTLSAYVGKYEPLYGGLKNATIIPEGVPALLLGHLLSSPCDQVLVKQASLMILANQRPIFFYSPSQETDISTLGPGKKQLQNEEAYVYGLLLALASVLGEFERLLDDFSEPNMDYGCIRDGTGENETDSESDRESRAVSEYSSSWSSSSAGSEPMSLAIGIPRLLAGEFSIFLGEDSESLSPEATKDPMDAFWRDIGKRLKLSQYLQFCTAMDAFIGCPRTQRFREACLAFLRSFSVPPEAFSLAAIGLWSTDPKSEDLESWNHFRSLSIKVGRVVRPAAEEDAGER